MLASGTHLSEEAVVITFGVEAEEGEAESVLAAGGSVAASGVAPCLHEYGHHVESIAQGGVLGGPGNGDGNFDGLTSEGDGQNGRTIGNGVIGVSVDADEGGVGQGERRFSSNVASRVVGEVRLDDDRLTITVGGEVDFGGEDLEIGDGRLVGSPRPDKGKEGERGGGQAGPD